MPLLNPIFGGCSRQLEFPATSRAKSGTESRFSNPCDYNDGIGNPSGRIPESLPGHQDNLDAIGVTGNPDIRVPEGMKSEDGLRTESRFSNPCDDNDGIGNPSGRIPESLPGHQDNVDAIGVTGNPDIRVPEGMKSEDGLRAACVLEGEDAGGDAKKDGRRNREAEQRPPTEKPKTSSVKDTTMNKEVRSWADTKANGGSGLCDLRIQHEAPFVTGSVRSCDPTVEAFGSRAAPTLELKGAPRVRPFRVYIVTGRLWHALS
ncbi:hypothetical protein NDU88_001039 [Pleurodeles waltl]|uniref:Uncharacterized protein n=1 Tax=Pleurodeles waltl TaxID=8319 RepID=A0AAV7VAM0_PLEWA|nr:hypothetical protein NDU88_001039 [Pleurodeles waltl]